MTTMISEVYDAFREAKVSEVAARKAAEAVAANDDRFTRIELRIVEVENRMARVENRMTRVEGRLTLLQWMVGAVIAIGAGVGVPSLWLLVRVAAKIGAIAVALVALAAPAVAQQVYVPGCVAFMSEYSGQSPPRANGAVVLCLRVPFSPDSQIAWDEVKAREAAQLARMKREGAECGYFNPPQTCTARVAQEIPFPTPSPATLGWIQSHRLSWE